MWLVSYPEMVVFVDSKEIEEVGLFCFPKKMNV
jgi:hypothetical protein